MKRFYPCVLSVMLFFSCNQLSLLGDGGVSSLDEPTPLSDKEVAEKFESIYQKGVKYIKSLEKILKENHPLDEKKKNS